MINEGISDPLCTYMVSTLIIRIRNQSATENDVEWSGVYE